MTARVPQTLLFFLTHVTARVPQVLLFFLLSFVNTILDSLKDTLVITAAGGGAQARMRVAGVSAWSAPVA
eukprot:360878-Chlamydomonas_euryale.AAC.1